ncbi:tail fiber assembly protein [Leclercia sp. UBA7405]|uniref:tail fiber assembly protein n=1 Tax=Leclercia sp. UBA7405 TaxID=1946743 RepID=UPI00301787CF
MKYFRDESGEIFAYEEDGSQDEFIGNKKPVTQEEVEKILNPPPTQEEIIAAAYAEKKRLTDDANDYINSKQLPGKAVLDRLTNAEKELYNEWLDYLDALEAVDTSSAPDIDWPSMPG